MTCRYCPACGGPYRDGKKEKWLCFASCHPTTEVDRDDACRYGIEDYAAYIQTILYPTRIKCSPPTEYELGIVQRCEELSDAQKPVKKRKG